jgi:uncharacterized iron-regulated membrane protein
MRAIRITLRVLLGILGGYALSAATSAAFALALHRLGGMDRAEATLLAGMFGFAFYLCVLLWALTTPALGRVATLRQSMGALHTWAGVVLGSVLFAVFWMGTLSVFDREIDRWMMPDTRLGPAPAVVLDAVARTVATLAPGAAQWSATLPTERTPTLQLRVPAPGGGSMVRHVDPSTGAVLDPTGTLGGSGFLFPFHFSLHLEWLDLGVWLVGLCGMAMLVLVVSGVIIHKRILRDFFMFRPSKALSRSSLDLHTAMGVLALPFHFIMPLSGLIIFFSVFFPGTWHAAFQGDRQAFNREAFGSYQRPKLGQPGPLASLDAMAAEAERSWGGGPPSFVRVLNAGDAASVVEVRRASRTEVSRNRDVVYFDGPSGAVLHHFGASPVGRVQTFLAGLHFVQFDHWLLRWLYFAGGISGCVMIATGFLFWLESRRAEHARRGWAGVRVVEALATGSVSGIILSTLCFLAANRLLPREATAAGLSRAQLEMAVFYLVWLASFGHAGWRVRAAWADQCTLIAAVAALLPPLNWVTTGDHPVRALGRGAFAVAGVDLVLLAMAAVAGVTARRLARRRTPELGRTPPVENAGLPGLDERAEREAAHG